MKTEFISNLKYTEEERCYAELLHQFKDQRLNFNRLHELDLPDNFNFMYFDSDKNQAVHYQIYKHGELNE